MTTTNHFLADDSCFPNLEFMCQCKCDGNATTSDGNATTSAESIGIAEENFDLVIEIVISGITFLLIVVVLSILFMKQQRLKAIKSFV